MSEERTDYQLLRRAALIAQQTDMAVDAPAETVLALLDQNQQLRQLMTTFVQAYEASNYYDASIGQHVSLPRGYIDEYVRQFRAALEFGAMMRDDRASDTLLPPMHRWQLRSGVINEVVNAPDQWAAWNTLRNRPLSEFGLITTAEADENADPIPVHTASLLFSWNRDDDARALIRLALELGLPDTTASDLAIAQKKGRS